MLSAATTASARTQLQTRPHSPDCLMCLCLPFPGLTVEPVGFSAPQTIGRGKRKCASTSPQKAGRAYLLFAAKVSSKKFLGDRLHATSSITFRNLSLP
jgi:hypothetical protein